MINLTTKTFEGLTKSLSDFLSSNKFDYWQTILNNNGNVDGFLVLFNHPVYNKLLNKLGFKSFKDWILKADKWNEEILNPNKDTNPESLVLYHLWNSLRKHMVDSLRQSRMSGELPQKGGVLCFIGGLSKCIIFKYEIVSNYPKIQPIDVIDNPKSAFDFWSITDALGLKEKNLLKEILSSGHKIIYHRGITVHVDRRIDIEVFGPTIDTLLLAEVINQEIFENKLINIEKAIEIGCGNGLLTVCLAKYANRLKKLVSIDINFLSLACCNKNVAGNTTPFQIEKIDLNLVKGNFDPKLFDYKFDLIVCNPPYIPLFDEKAGKYQSKKDYFEAVGGLQLIDEILSSLETMLNANGKLLLLVSSLSLDYTINNIPTNYTHEIIIPKGYDVLFDVEAVLNNTKWFNFLKDSGGLFEKYKFLYHKLYPIWIFKK
ncbi:MAG: methyltransferase [Bacteroidales bacterium]|nr:methyltransferase [Bacteroidales bacterium]